MSERDELVDIVYRGNYNNPLSPFIQPLEERSQDEIDRTRRTADAILAAGYRKPRTITTAEELDGLAVGSVVLHNGRAFQHYAAYPAPFDEYQKWKCGDGGFVRSTKSGDMILPATVLYEPTA